MPNRDSRSLVPDTIRVLLPSGRVMEMRLETYLAGAVAMAMGANAPLEALKAQAVASRTYAARAQRHTDIRAGVCTTSHCQKWKRVDPIVAPEVFRAVSETWGTVALFEEKLIAVFFFENCAGRTRDAEEMAMPALPYLRSIECGCGFAEMKGHGVGMCQRGAIVMARQGATYKEILQHYYKGIEVVQTRSDVTAIAPVDLEPAGKPKRSKKASAKRSAPPPPPQDDLSALLDALNQAASTLVPPNESSPSTPPKAPDVPASGMGEPVRASSADAKLEPQESQGEEATPAPEVIHVDVLPGPRLIAGSLTRAGVRVQVEDLEGRKQSVFSGSSPQYGEGGFEIAIDEDGYYTVLVDGQIIEVNVQSETVFLRSQGTAESQHSSGKGNPLA